MRIDKKLNLVVPIYDEEGKVPRFYVHSTPVGTDIWEKYWEPISLAFTRVMGGGHGIMGGPRIADKMLCKVAKDMGLWDGPEGIERGLMAEIYRLTNVVAPRDKGWETIPYEEAKRTLIEPEDANEIEGALVFFTLISLMNRRTIRREMLDSAMGLWGAQIVLWDCTAFINSLAISTGSENSGATVGAL